MVKVFHSRWVRVVGVATTAALVAAVAILIGPSIVPTALAQDGPGSTVPPGSGIVDFIFNIFMFIQGLLSGIFEFIFPIFGPLFG